MFFIGQWCIKISYSSMRLDWEDIERNSLKWIIIYCTTNSVNNLCA